MTDYPTALAAALDAQKPSGFAYRYRDALAGGTVIRFNSGHEVNGSRPIEAVPYWLGAPPAPVAPAAVVPEGGLRDSVLNSAKFRASCYALVGIVEGIQGLGRCWAANGERLKDTPEWVAFYNCAAAMRNGTFNQASAEQAPPAAAVPADDAIEAAYWDFDARHKGYGPHKMTPQSERDAFKWAVRALLAAAERKGGES